MKTIQITKGKGELENSKRADALQKIENTLTTDNLVFISSLCDKTTINSSLSNSFKRGVLKSNV